LMTTQTLRPEQRATLVTAATGRGAGRPLVHGVRVLTPPPATVTKAEPHVQPVATSESDVRPEQVGIERLLETGEASAQQRTRTLTARIRQQLTELQQRVDGEAVQREAEARVAELRAQLAAAELQLRQARRSGSPSPSPEPAGDGGNQSDQAAVNRAVRQWAAANGIEVNQRGSVRRDVLERWQAATGSGVIQ
jgi:nucleoid-associated protein Lsr2